MLQIRIQRILGYIFLLPLGTAVVLLLRFYSHFKINNISEVRKKFKECVHSKKPIIICSNHLTLIDSVIMHWAFAPLYWYLFNYRCFSWNLPAVENVKKNIAFVIITFLTKCIWIERNGTSEETNRLLEQVRDCLRSGDLVTVFPEGTRSRSGRIDIDNTTYGVGKIIQGVPDCSVLCVYLRGVGQAAYSDFPRIGERFDIELELIKPESRHQGLRASRDISLQIVNKLKEMEDRYFDQKD